MNNNIKATIITPSYNSERTIERTIESVINQTYKNIEYIIVDGGSTDDTLQIIDKYKKSANIDFHVISEPDNGVYDAMNKGIERASGELIGIINSDDYYECDAVSDMVNSMTIDKLQILYGFQRVFEQGIEKRIVIYSHRFLEDQMITHPTCFVTKTVYEKYGLFNLEYKSSADYEFMLRVSRHEDVKFVPVYKIISNFALGGMSGSVLGSEETAKLKYEYGIISKSRYYFLKMFFTCYRLSKMFLQGLSKRKNSN